jgi:NADH-quinone oxidoreductase subunit E
MKTFAQNPVPESVIDDLIDRHQNKPGGLLTILEEAQELNSLKFLPSVTLSLIAKKLKVPFIQVYSVVTFYSFFNLKPQGKHTITVCRGTACHTKGSKALLDDLYPMLKMENSQTEQTCTTPDNLFTIKTVACFGQCALAVVAIDGVIYSNVNTRQLLKMVNQIKVLEKETELNLIN